MAQKSAGKPAKGASKTPAKNTTAKTTSAKASAAKTNTDKLVIVESPAKAKTIEKLLGKGYKVIASNGHVRDLPKSQLGVDVEHGFEPKYVTLRGRGDVLERIRQGAKNAKTIYLATDPDREGEAISWHLAAILGLNEKDKCRIVFNEITGSAIKNAIKEPRAIDINLVNAQQARRILDRLVGYKLSPLLWSKVRKRLSAGRVQSVATRIICDREQEIADFVPEEYWDIVANLLNIKGKKLSAKLATLNGKKLEVKSKAQADEVLAALKGAKFTVSDIKKGEKSRHAPAPFTTSNLQQEASRKLGFTGKRTMLIAQQLYEGVEVKGRGAVGLVTYIRTDSVRIANEALSSVREHIKAHYGDKYVPEKPNFYKGRKGAQDAHEAIRPTYVELSPASIKDSLTPEQFKLYKLIYERFLACQMPPALYETLNASIETSAGYGFKTAGSRLIFDGYMAVYVEGRDDDSKEKDVLLPELNKGDALKNEGVTADQHFTQPPPHYTEATLVKALEDKGIGRPSTYAPTISTILERGYVLRERKNLLASELGQIVTQLMKDNFSDVVDVEFTAQMEERLDGVEEGAREWSQVLSDFYGPFEKTLKIAEANIPKVEIADEVSDIQCEKCGAMMVYKYGRFGKFLACPNFPNCRNAKPIVESIDTPCPKCGAKLLKRKAKKGGRIFYGCEKYPECDFVSWDLPLPEKCPKCGALMVRKFSKAGNLDACVNKDCGYSVRSKPANAGAKE